MNPNHPLLLAGLEGSTSEQDLSPEGDQAAKRTKALGSHEAATAAQPPGVSWGGVGQGSSCCGAG